MAGRVTALELRGRAREEVDRAEDLEVRALDPDRVANLEDPSRLPLGGRSLGERAAEDEVGLKGIDDEPFAPFGCRKGRIESDDDGVLDDDRLSTIQGVREAVGGTDESADVVLFRVATEAVLLKLRPNRDLGLGGRLGHRPTKPERHLSKPRDCGDPRRRPWAVDGRSPLSAMRRQFVRPHRRQLPGYGPSPPREGRPAGPPIRSYHVAASRLRSRPVTPSQRRDTAFLPTVVALFLVSLALRPPLVGIGPLLPAIERDLALGHGPAGLLGAIPVLCMGIFAPLGSWLARRLGAEAAIAVGIAAIAGFGFLRAAAPEATSVLVTTFGIGVGIGLVGPILTIVVHTRVPDRPALATGTYATGIILGATIAGAVAVPLAGAEGDWRRALAAFALAATGSLLAWLVLERPSPRHRAVATDEGFDPAIPWRDRRGWALALVFGLQSILFYAIVSWLPFIQVERGWSEAGAGFLVALMNGVSLISVLGVPALADRRGERRLQLAGSSLLSLTGLLGLTIAPALVPLWVCLLGLGLGAVFPLALTLPVDLADDPHEVGRLAAIMLLGGYVLSTVGPVLLGVLRDLLGDFEAGLWLLVATAAGLALASWRLVPRGIGGRAEEPAVG